MIFPKAGWSRAQSARAGMFQEWTTAVPDLAIPEAPVGIDSAPLRPVP